MASLKKRGPVYYAQFYVGTRQVRRCLHTRSYQVAREKLRQIQSALFRGDNLYQSAFLGLLMHILFP